MKPKFLIPFLAIFATMLIISSCRKPAPQTEFPRVEHYSYDVIHQWNELFLQIDKDAMGFRPGPGPRALGYMGIAAYEICIPGMPNYNSLKNLPQFQGSGIPSYTGSAELHYPTAINAAYAFLMSHFFEKVEFFNAAGSTGKHLTNAEAQQMIENLKNSLETEYKQESNVNRFNNSKAWGEEVARAVWQWSTTDRYGHEAYLNPLNNDPSKFPYYNWREKSLDANGKRIPGKWMPTNDNPDGGMFPFWGNVRTFATNNQQKLSKPPIPAYLPDGSVNPKWHTENLEVYSSTTARSYEDQWIAEFWSDDLFGLTFAPPPRLLAIMDQIMVAKNSNLEEAVYANALMGITLNDCAVVCWNSKWVYNTERPEHYIKDNIDPNWESSLDHPYTGQKGVTPAFPAYPSGHSTFGGGGAWALATVWGNNTYFVDRCHESRKEFIGTPRPFYSFSVMGREDAISRIPLGVHIRIDCEEGVRLGEEVARRAADLPWRG